MNTSERIVIWSLISLALTVALATAAGANRAHDAAATDSQQLDAHIQQHADDEANRTAAFAVYVEQQDKRAAVLTSKLDELNRQVTGLLLRKPPSVSTKWITNADAELRKRIDATERRMLGIEP